MPINNIKYIQPIQGSSASSATFVEGTTEVGGENTLLIADMSSRELLEAILIELMKLNLRQQEAFEETVNEGDLNL